MHACAFSHVRRFVTPWNVAHQACGIFQAGTLERLAFPPAGDLPDPGTEPMSLVPPALAGGFFISWATQEAPVPFNRTLKPSKWRGKSCRPLRGAFVFVRVFPPCFCFVLLSFPSLRIFQVHKNRNLPKTGTQNKSVSIPGQITPFI